MISTVQSPLNRRYSPRYKRRFSVLVKTSELKTSIQAYCINVSASGIRITLNLFLNPDDASPDGRSCRDASSGFKEKAILELTLLINSSLSLNIKGQAIWQQCIGTLGTHVLGIEFTEDNHESRAKLARFLALQGQAA